MAYDERLAARIRTYLKPLEVSITEKRMFGGLSFLYKGKMTVGVIKNKFTARVVGVEFNDVLQEKGVEPMDFTGKPLKNFVYVDVAELKAEEQLSIWIERGIQHAKEQLGEL